MSRILKRPMFRIGGSTNEGIMSNVVPKRAGYQNPTGAATTEDNYTVDINDPLYRDAMKKAAILSQLAGPGRSERDRLLDLLLQGSIRLASETPRGGIIPTIAKSFEQPVSEYLKSGETEDTFKRQLRLAAATQAMAAQDAQEKYKKEMEIAKMKLYDDQLKLFAATTGLGPTAPEVFNTIQYLKERKIPVSESPIALKNGKLDVESVLTLPKGTRFFDSTGKFYVRTDTGAEQVYGKTGEKVIRPTVEKKPGFFESAKESGAAYDPRSWNKQRFYEELAKKKSTME